MTMAMANPSLNKQEHPVAIAWEQFSPWQQEQLEELLNFSEQHHWLVHHISEHQSKTLEGVIGIWHISFESHNKLKMAWIITGDLITDVIPCQGVSTAREALLFFSRKYLSRAQYIRQQCFEQEPDEQQMQAYRAKMEAFVKASADLLVLYHEKKLW